VCVAIIHVFSALMLVGVVMSNV